MANIDQARDMAQDTAKQVLDTIEDSYRQYKPQIERYQTDLMSTVRDKPIQSLAIAGALAFLIGAIWKK